MKGTSGKYSEMDLVKNDSAHAKNYRTVGHSVKLNSHEWDETVQKLIGIFSDSSVEAGVSPAQPTRLPPQKSAPLATVLPSKQASITKIKTGVISPLQEDEQRYYATAILNKTAERLNLATVSWLKEPLESWIARAENRVPIAMVAASGNYALPKISVGGCIDDTWAATAGPPGDRYSHTAVWTGSEMIVWGGQYGQGITAVFLDTGGRYNPGTDTWAATSGINAPTARGLHTAVNRLWKRHITKISIHSCSFVIKRN